MNTKKTRNNEHLHLTLTFLLGGLLLGAEALATEPVAEDARPNRPNRPSAMAPFATVGKDIITWQDYRNAYNSEAGNRFFHGKPSDDVLASYQREVATKLVNDALLVQEAKRRKLKPDDAAVNQELQKYDQRFGSDPKWPEARKRVLPQITKRLQNENLLSQLEELVRNVPPPTMKQLHDYYDAHPEKFTAPPQPRVSVILLRVDPSSPDEDWNKAMEEGEGLVKRLRAGEDFATLARDYSGDTVTAEEGGDMGYLHTGMLPGLPEEVVSKLQPGETADPVKLLEGVAIFRLTDRIQPPPSSFESSQERVAKLLIKDQSDMAWDSLIAKLRKKARIHVDESRFLPLNATAGNPAKDKGTASPATK